MRVDHHHTLTLIIAFVASLFCPGATLATGKIIKVDLTQQRLVAYEDGELIHDFPVSTGKQATPTPNGGFWPWIKLRRDGMSGGSRVAGTYYNLPNVPFVVYFYNQNYPRWMGYGLHGTYWHSNFGNPMSHGCINLRTQDMAKLFPWIDTLDTPTPTMIRIVGQTPGKTDKVISLSVHEDLLEI